MSEITIRQPQPWSQDFWSIKLRPGIPSRDIQQLKQAVQNRQECPTTFDKFNLQNSKEQTTSNQALRQLHVGHSRRSTVCTLPFAPSYRQRIPLQRRCLTSLNAD